MAIVNDILVFLSLVLFFRWCYDIYKKNRQLRHIPGPLPIPFIGVKLPRNIYEITHFFDGLIEQYGNTFKYYLGNTLVVATCDADLIQAIVQSSKHIQKSRLYDISRIWLKDGLIVSTGDKWRQRRKLLNPSFHVSILKEFFAVFKDNSNKIVASLEQEAAKEKPIDVGPFLAKFAADVIAESSFGSKLGIQEGHNPGYLESLDKVLKLISMRNFSLWKWNDMLYKLFAKEYSEQSRCIGIVDSVAQKIIENKREDIDPDSQTRMNTKKRSVLIEALMEHPDITNEDVHEEVNNFMFAGYDTTSTSLSFLLYELSRHQDIQEKLYQEIMFHIDGDIGNLDVERLQKMNYLDLVLKESLRHRTTVSAIERLITEDAKFGDTVYPSGTVFVILLHWLHNNPAYYDHPEKFDPERFNVENSSKRHRFAYIPFSAGPRNCIGQKYAILEVKTVIAKILFEFQILPVEGSELEVVSTGISKSNNGYPIKLQRRQ
ncbi:unnamed protein product [Phyllotreta striolata]|uniref:Cytochrome P450 monooxygenase n=1 Tax=Phyllotreta striolata TaxID=444603 RepID=A0A9N9TKW0_PHYSR|nr:unnamed protein product [Phyllotreta striolata]